MLSFIVLISFILFSIYIQSLTNAFNLLSLLSNTLSNNNFPFSKETLNFFGNLSPFFIISSSKNKFLNCSSTFNKS